MLLQRFRINSSDNYGSIAQWMKLVNSVRLRLAIRLSKVAPDVAKVQGEKAMKDPAGLLTTNKDNFLNSLLGNILPLAQADFGSQGYISRSVPMYFSYFMQVNGLYAYKFCHGISLSDQGLAGDIRKTASILHFIW